MARRQEWQKEDATTPQEDDSGPPPPTRAELAERLVRYDGNLEEKWRTCREPVCRRRRTCSAAYVPCWDPADVAGPLHDTDPLVRGAARMMSTYGASRRKR
jgi:hypothetical protein